MKPYRYLFGPVLSRRLGRSLGVDLVPAKTCALDCVFCQLGRTGTCRVERREYVPTAAVLRELRDWIAGDQAADFITLAGSGEPTLHTRFGDVLECARGCARCRTALLSNGVLFSLPEVRAAAARAHVVKLTLSAWDQTSFRALHRPHPQLRLDRIVASYRAFRAEFSGELWLEVFLVPGLNTAREQVRRIAAIDLPGQAWSLAEPTGTVSHDAGHTVFDSLHADEDHSLESAPAAGN